MNRATVRYVSVRRVPASLNYGVIRDYKKKREETLRHARCKNKADNLEKLASLSYCTTEQYLLDIRWRRRGVTSESVRHQGFNIERRR